MGAQNKLFHRLIWLIDTVYSAKRINIRIDSLLRQFIEDGGFEI